MEDNFNWFDPDILADDETIILSDNPKTELEFKEFFEIGWLDPMFDDIRERWDPLIHDEDPQGRLLGKVALWNLVGIRRLKDKNNES